MQLIQCSPSSPTWQAWLPVLASTIVAAATLWGIWRNNKAADKRNRDALDASVANMVLTNEAAADREVLKWRREALLEALASAVRTSREIAEELLPYPNANVNKYDIAGLRQTESKIHSLRTSASLLLMLDASDLSDICFSLNSAYSDATSAILDIYRDLKAEEIEPELAVKDSRFDGPISRTHELDARLIVFGAKALGAEFEKTAGQA